MRVETAFKSCSSTESFLRAPMASIRNGSSSWRVRSASVSVNNRWGCSGCSSRSSSWSSGMLFRPFPGQHGAYGKDNTRMCRSLAKRRGRSGLAADEDHGARRRLEAGFVDAMAGFFFGDHGANAFLDVMVGSAVAQQGAEVVIVLAEEAGPDLAVGGEADARTVAAKGLGDGGDQVDFTGSAVGKFILARGFAFRVGNLHQLPLRVNAPVDFLGGDHQFARPVAVGVERHEFDEAHDYTAVAGEGGEGFHFVFVEAADEDGVDFCGAERRILGGVDSAHHGVIGAGTGDFFKLDGIERIEADVDAVQAGGDQGRNALGQEVTVGGHGNVRDTQFIQFVQEGFRTRANQRFAAGDAHFLDAKTHKDARQAFELWPGQNLIVLAVIFGVGGAAIDAAEVAAVGDRDAEVGDLASELVVKRHQRGPEKKNPIRAWNRAIAGNLHIYGVQAPFQTREAKAFPPKPSASRPRPPRSAAMGCLSRS